MWVSTWLVGKIKISASTSDSGSRGQRLPYKAEVPFPWKLLPPSHGSIPPPPPRDQGSTVTGHRQDNACVSLFSNGFGTAMVESGPTSARSRNDRGEKQQRANLCKIGGGGSANTNIRYNSVRIVHDQRRNSYYDFAIRIWIDPCAS